jgi:hypothetical protein
MIRICTVFFSFLILFGATAPKVEAQGDASITVSNSSPAPILAANETELFRIRIVNRRDGAIQVTTDSGATWRLIGRVLNPATTVAEGYTAAQYAAPGTVAAIAVHGIRVRVGADDATLHDPLVLSIDPVEYARTEAQNPQKGYGGQVTGSAGILTDIHAGTSLFREIAPLVGNRVSRELPDGSLAPLDPAFRPTGKGETLVITVTAPRVSLTEVTFGNRVDGAVQATFSDGTSREITRVVQPLRGTGRFDGTSFTGPGRVNTDHTGVITISTAPLHPGSTEGDGPERRGGFQISPAWHNARLEEAGAPMVMTLGSDPGGPRKRELEGTAPLFMGAISLGDGTSASALCDMSVDNGPWEPMPILVGNLTAAFTAEGLNRVWKDIGISRTSTMGVTAFRLRLAPLGADRARESAESAVSLCESSGYAVARTGGLPIVKGVLTVNANPTNARNVAYVRLLVEDTPRGFTNVSPFALTWNTLTVPDGEYLVEADALDADGAVLAVTRRKVFVLNHDPPRAAVASRAQPVGGGQVPGAQVQSRK